MDECDCGYCGKCQKQWQHENDTQPEVGYDKPVEDDKEPEHYYWRL